MIKKLFVVFAALAIATPASRLMAAGEGTQGASFLKIGPGARALAMGGAGAALVENAEAVYWNPANIGRLKEDKSSTASFTSLSRGSWQGFLAVAGHLPESPGAVGFGAHYAKVLDVDRRSDTGGDPQFLLNNRDFALTTAFGYEFENLQELSLGTGVKFIRETRGEFSRNSFAADFGGSFKVDKKMVFGLTVQNIGGRMGPDALPLALRGGGAIAVMEEFTIAVESETWLKERRSYIDLGLEHRFKEEVAFRIGYQLGRRQEKSSPTGGLSLGIGGEREKVEWGYAAVPEGGLGLTHRVSLGFKY